MIALFVILTIVVCIAVDSIVQYRRARREGELEPKEWAGPVYAFEKVRTPEGLFFDDGHTWVQLAPDGTASIGADGFATSVIGRVDGIDLPKVGAEVRRGDRLFALRQGDRVAEFKAPIDGFVSSIDEELARRPDCVKTAPFTEGWICSLSPKNLAQNLKRLRIAEDARDWMHDEIEQFKHFFAARPLENVTVGQVLQDGGQLTGGVLEFMDDETWRLFNERFLNSTTSKEA
jgi:glycine cleavage system H protein